MDRRTALRVAAGALATLLGGCLGAPPTATGPRHAPDAPADQPRRTPDRPDLAIVSFDFEATESGALRVFGTVENRGAVQRTTTVSVTVSVDGDDIVRERSLTVDAEATSEWAITFDVDYEEFARNGNLSVDLG